MSDKKVLLVEDDETIRQLLKDSLADEGIELLLAEDGEEGLRVALKEKPALILADIMMPVMDGISMLKKLRQDPWGKDASVIMLTNIDDDKSVQAATALGVAYYWLKANWNLEELFEKIDEMGIRK